MSTLGIGQKIRLQGNEARLGNIQHFLYCTLLICYCGVVYSYQCINGSVGCCQDALHFPGDVFSDLYQGCSCSCAENLTTTCTIDYSTLPLCPPICLLGDVCDKENKTCGNALGYKCTCVGGVWQCSAQPVPAPQCGIVCLQSQSIILQTNWYTIFALLIPLVF